MYIARLTLAWGALCVAAAPVYAQQDLPTQTPFFADTPLMSAAPNLAPGAADPFHAANTPPVSSMGQSGTVGEAAPLAAPFRRAAPAGAREPVRAEDRSVLFGTGVFSRRDARQAAD